MKFAYAKNQDYKLGYLQENLEMVIYAAICFFVPFFMGHPQIVVGVVVNAALIMAALNIRDYRLLPITIFPSLGVLSRGLIFGPFTIYLVYMIPFIWLGNAILVYSFKRFNLGMGLNKMVTLVLGAVLKTAFLFGSAFILVKLAILPPVFLTAMGLMQLTTALIGGAIALTAQRVKRTLNL